MIIHKPPMGWNTWNTFGDKINEQLILESADAMVDTGLLEAGYEYIVIDEIPEMYRNNPTVILGYETSRNSKSK